MSAYALPIGFLAVVYIAMVALNERFDLFRDRFPNAFFKWAAYVWLGLLMLVLGVLVVDASQRVPTPEQLAKVPFYSLFLLHAILIIFLIVYWLLAGMPKVTEFFNLRRENLGTNVLTGFAVGVGGWLFTIVAAVTIGLILKSLGLFDDNQKPAPMIVWLASQSVWKKLLIVLSAMTVEELFFRGWLQKRVGLIVSTLLFALAHSGFGQPMLLVAVGVISLVIGATFHRTKNLVPCMVAHGVFDAVQIFVIIPIVLKATGTGL